MPISNILNSKCYFAATPKQKKEQYEHYDGRPETNPDCNCRGQFAYRRLRQEERGDRRAASAGPGACRGDREAGSCAGAHRH